MPTLYNPGAQHATFTPISSALNNLQAGAGTIAALARKVTTANAAVDILGLMDAARGNWYHSLEYGATALNDDDGIVFNILGGVTFTTDWYITVVTWASGTVTERSHYINQSSPAGWTHADASSGVNGGNRAGPGTIGHFEIGFTGDFSATDTNTALVAAWVGVALSDAQCTELIANNRTSDWWNCSAGQPTLLIECNTLTPTDIGANPSTFSSIGSLTLAGSNPTWNFNGRAPAAPAVRPDFRQFPKSIMRSL
jgi:hypothetical protein